MTPKQKTQIEQTQSFVFETLDTECSGHDRWHIERVWKMARYLAQREGGNLFVVELSALLHDIADWKFHGGNEEVGPQKARAWLQKIQIESMTIDSICQIMKEISFKGAKVKDQPSTLEAKIVQDADRLDAMGAIGIARTFAFGGHVGNSIYDPRVKPTLHEKAADYVGDRSHTINHFYEKLLLLKDRMNTKAGREIAQERHQKMEDFLQEFYSEWNFPD